MYVVKIKTYPDDGSDWVVAHSADLDNACRLYDGKLTLVHSGISDLEFSLLYGHPLFDIVTPMKSRVQVIRADTAEEVFVGRVIDITNKMDTSGVIYRTFTAEGELALLCDTMQRHQAFVKNTPYDILKQVVVNHNLTVQNSVPDKSFTLGRVAVSGLSGMPAYHSLTYKSSYETVMDDLVGPLGGNLAVRKNSAQGSRYLDYEPVSAVQGGISIELAKNLRSIEEKRRPSRMITRLLPLGATYETVADALMVLENANVVVSPNTSAYWLSTLHSMTWLGQLLINLSKLSYTENNTVTDVPEAIEILSEAGAINTPEYWLKRYESKEPLANLLKRAAGMCGRDAEKPKRSTEIKRRLTISAINGGSDYLNSSLISQYGVIEGSVVWNDVTDPYELYNLAKSYLTQQTVRTSVTLSALELQDAGGNFSRFEVGKVYSVNHAPLGLNNQSYQVVQKVVDLLDESRGSLTFGEADIRITTI